MDLGNKNLIEIKRLSDKLWILYSLLKQSTDKNTTAISSFEDRVDKLSAITASLNELLAGQDVDEFLENLKKTAQLANSYLPIGVDSNGQPDPSALLRLLWHHSGEERWINLADVMEINLSSGIFKTDAISTYNSSSLTIPKSLQTEVDSMLELKNFGITLQKGFPVSMINAWKSVDTSLIPEEQADIRDLINAAPERYDIHYVAETYKYGDLNYSSSSKDNRANTLVTVKYLDEFYEAPESSSYLRANYNNNSIYWDSNTGFLTMNAPTLSSAEGGVLNLNKLTFGARSNNLESTPVANGIASIINMETITGDRDKYLLTLAAAESFAGINTLPQNNPSNSLYLMWDNSNRSILNFRTNTATSTNTTNPNFYITGLKENETMLRVTTTSTNTNYTSIYPNGIKFNEGQLVSSVVTSNDPVSNLDTALVTAGYIEKHSVVEKKLSIFGDVDETISINWKTLSDSSIIGEKQMLVISDSTTNSRGLMLENLYGLNDNATKLSELEMKFYGNMSFENENLIKKGSGESSIDAKLNQQIIGVVNNENAVNLFENVYSFNDNSSSDKVVPTFAAVKSIVQNYAGITQDKKRVTDNLQILVNNTQMFLKRSPTTEITWPTDYMRTDNLEITTTVWIGLKEIGYYLANNLKNYLVRASSDGNTRNDICNTVISYLNNWSIYNKGDLTLANEFNENVIKKLYLVELMLQTNSSQVIENIIGSGNGNSSEKMDKSIVIPANTSLYSSYSTGNTDVFDKTNTYLVFGIINVNISNVTIQNYAENLGDFINYIDLEITIGDKLMKIKPILISFTDSQRQLILEFDVNNIITEISAVENLYPIEFIVKKRYGIAIDNCVVASDSTIHIKSI